jgi:PAS domain S-box-containing protein
MHASIRFKRQTLALFFIVSLVPALLVAAIWYWLTQLSYTAALEIDFSHLVLPVFLVGVLPAIVLSFIFAELLARPVRDIHHAVMELAAGNFSPQPSGSAKGEFKEINTALKEVALHLQDVISTSSSETALIEAERNKLRGVLNSMSDGVFALDRDGRIILFNKAATELTGRAMTEVAGQLAEKVMPFRQNGELVMTRWLATHSGTPDKLGQWRNLELYHSDGSSLYVNVDAITLKDDPNGISALVTFHDLTRDHQLEEMKVDFVALAAHELRTPLTEIKGYLDIMQHEAKGLRKSDRELLDRSVASAAELSGLMNNLLNVARIEHGELNYNPEIIDFKAYIEALAPDFESQVARKGLSLTMKIPAHLPPIMADPVGIHEVFRNLLSNASNHTPDGGNVTIKVKSERNLIEITVTDNGSGIPANAIGRLFTKFYRVNEYKSSTRGTGLGLYICRSIVDAHGGHIWVESVEGKGSTFGFTLPVTRVAQPIETEDNHISITRGTHGWIKKHTIH